MGEEAADSVDTARLIDSVCDDFEQALAAGEAPQIEVFLGRVPSSLRQSLLLELLGLEVEFRVARGQQPAASDYATRFPELSPEQLTAILEAPRAGAENTPTVIGASADTTSHLPTRVLRYFGDYELLRELARGGMGVVYQARQTNLNRIVAVKLILAGQFAHEEEIQRFRREAESAAQLDHPHIVPVFETGAVDGQYFLSMGFVDGQSLAQRIAQGPLDPRDAAALLKILADAIAYAHAKKIIHRDLKPGNVLLDSGGVPHITDFGLAKTLEEDSDLTSTGRVMGTPSYMPPEQALGQTQLIGPRSDVYSLGAILYCLLTGKPPFQADSVVDTLKQVVDREPRSISTLRRGVPIDLETICTKCLEKNPDNRYQSADELSADLQRFLEGRPISARPVSRAEHVLRWVLRNPMVSSLMAGVVLVAVAGTIAFNFQQTATQTALGKVAVKEAENQRSALEAAATRAEAIQADLARLQTSEEANRQGQALQLIREAVQLRTSALAKSEHLSLEARTAWTDQESLLRTTALHWLSRNLLTPLQLFRLDSRSYGDQQQRSGESWMATDLSGKLLAVPRQSLGAGGQRAARTIELFDLSSGGQIAEFPIDEKSCPNARPAAVAFSADARRLYVVVYNPAYTPEAEPWVIQTYELPSGTLVSTGRMKGTKPPGWEPRFRFDDSRRWMLMTHGAEPAAWDLVEQKVVEAPGLVGFSDVASFAGDGTAAARGTTRNIFTGKVLSQVPLPRGYSAPLPSGNGQWLIELKNPENFGSGRDAAIGILDASTGKEIATVAGLAGNVQTQMFNDTTRFRDPPILAVAPDAPYVAVLSKTELIACELPQGTVIARYRLEPSDSIVKPVDVRFLGNQRLLTVIELRPDANQSSPGGFMGNRYQLQTWELSVSKSSPMKSVPLRHEPLDVACSPGGDAIVTVGSQNALRVFTADGTPRTLGISEQRPADPNRPVRYKFLLNEYRNGLLQPSPTKIHAWAGPDPDRVGIAILDADTKAVRFRLARSAWKDVRGVELHPNEKYWLITTKLSEAGAEARRPPNDRTIVFHVVGRETGAEILSIPLSQEEPLLGLQHDILLGVEADGIGAYDLSTGQRLAQLKHDSVAALVTAGFTYGTSLSPTGRQAVLMVQKSSGVYQPLLWDISSNTAALLETTWRSQEAKQVTWTADGTRLLLKGTKPGATSRTVELWSVAERQKLATTAGRGAADFLDRPQLIAGTNLAYVGLSLPTQASLGEVWDLQTGATVRSYPRAAYRFSADGRYFVMAEPKDPPIENDASSAVYETATGRKLIDLAENAVAFSPDGQLLLCCPSQPAPRLPLALWNVTTQQRWSLDVSVPVSYSGAAGTAFDPTGQRFAVFDSPSLAVKVWNVATGQLVQTVALLTYPPVSASPAITSSIAFSPDGTQIVAHINGRGHTFDVATGTLLSMPTRGSHLIQGMAGAVLASVAYNHDGSLLATAGADATVQLWNTQTGQFAGLLETFGGAVTSVRFAANENQVVTRDAVGNLTLWGLDRNIPQRSELLQPRVIWNRTIAGVEVQQRGAPGIRFAQLAISQGGAAQIALPAETGEVKLVDWKTGEVTSSISGTGQITGLAFHPEQPLLAAAYASKLVRLLNYESGAIVREWEVPEFPLSGLAFSLDGKHVVTVGHDVMFWNIATGQKDLQNELPSTALTAVAVNPATGSLVVTAADQTLTIWNPYAIKEQLEALGLRWD